MSTVDLKSKLLADRVSGDGNTGTIEIEGVGTLTFRKLNRLEVIRSGEIGDTLKQEQFILARALVDPVLTEAEVATWQANSEAYEINRVADAINKLSGLKRESAKEQYKSVPE